jgi:hypothetical protein
MSPKLRRTLAAMLACTMTAALATQPKIRYPETKQVEHYDTYHGIKVARSLPLAGRGCQEISRGRCLG